MEESKVPVPARILLRPEDSPGYRSNPNPIRLTANFYRFSLTGSRLGLQKHSVDFEPDVPAQISRTREAILRRIAIPIREMLGRFVFANTVLYSVSQQTSSEESFTLSTNYNNIDYQITFTPVGTVNSNEELKAFYNKFFNFIQGKLQLVMIGRRFYDPERRMVLQGRDIEIWPGYTNSVSNYQAGCLLNVDVAHRCVSTVTVLEQIDELKRKYPREFLNEANRRFSNSIVLTRYNRKPYHVDHIDWDCNPMSTFNDANGPITYMQYYQTRWNIRIRNEDQPLLVATVRDDRIYLIPELCLMTGITDEIRLEVTRATQKSPQNRLQECCSLVNSALSNPAVQGEINEWRVTLANRPLEVNGSVISVGDIELGKGERFRSNPDYPNFDREVQKPMYTQVGLSIWGIFYQENDQALCDTLVNEFGEVIRKQYGFAEGRPKCFSIPVARRGQEWQEWDRVLREKVTRGSGVQLIVCILPGSRGKSSLYDNLKRLTLSTIPVPSQVVLNGTLRKDRGLRSVITKLAIQMNAKVGGIPWVISNIPLNDIPTMIVGIDVYHKKGSHSVLGFCATTNRSFSKYTSTARIQMESQEITGLLREALRNAIRNYMSDNDNTAPRRIIIFRDGVSDSQIPIVLETEVRQIKSTLQEMHITGKISQEPKLCFIVVNKRVNARFYGQAGGQVSNPPVGVCIDSDVTKENGYDFFIVTTKTNQGVVSPTHFNVVFDDTSLGCEGIQDLSYKLCYMYYNWSGPIKVPAPCMYAHKIAYLYGERISQTGQFEPHPRWSDMRSLYFL
jgi:aubergine-like protein